MRGIDLSLPRRRTRRRESARAGTPDLRRTLRRSFRTGGEPVERAWRRRRRQTRRLVLLLDVSGSMDAYSRALVMFAHAALRADRRWEAFCFGTRLTRVTRQLEGSDPDEALRRAAAEAGAEALLVTGTDRVKLHGRLALGLAELPVAAQPEAAFWRWLDGRLAEILATAAAGRPEDGR
jgi:uncharacterized protein with von Willebrand factor type A (vWA) domain